MKPLRRILTAAAVAALAVSCGGSGSGSTVPDPPELFTAVPSDALCVGIYNHLDKGMESMLDSSDVLRTLNYGKLLHARAALAICDIGTLFPLVIIDAGKHSTDSSASVRSLLAQADSLRLAKAYVSLQTHDALILSASETVITVVRRHLASESSVLDAPDFDKVVEAMPGGDAMICRNRGIPKVFAGRLAGPHSRRALSFLRDASEWTIFSDGKVIPVHPEAEKYFCNFCASLSQAPSQLASVLPDSTSLVIDIPIADPSQFRNAYEGWLDACVALETYQGRLKTLKKKTGLDPLKWESGLGIKEVAVIEKDGIKLNLLRTSSSVKSEDVEPNPNTGFLHALYGEDFNPSDSCMTHRGKWIISGPRAALEAFGAEKKNPSSWPQAARMAVQLPPYRIVWTNDNIKIWDSNR